jgi:UDP-GlcNAc3NAcA epimerase
MHILTVVGARPQFVKAAVVSHAIRGTPGMRETLLHTGQHFNDNMSAVFFDELGIPPPEVNLGIHGGSHGAMTGRMLQGIEEALAACRADMVLVYGDTNSTLAGALAAAKQRVPVAHVEAGLRSGNRRMPEEINRVLTDHAADLLLAPTAAAVANLAREGIAGETVSLVGDVMADAALRFRALAFARSGILGRLGLQEKGYALCTVHRAENTEDPVRLCNIFVALDLLAKDMQLVLPLHPRTLKVLVDAGFDFSSVSGLLFIDPVGYLDMARLEAAAALIVTDSGGVQKEAYLHQVPCVTLRDETEWPELVKAGWNRLAPPSDPRAMLHAMRSAIGSAGAPCDLYGKGDAAARIVHAIDEFRL